MMVEKPTPNELNRNEMLPKVSSAQWQTIFDAINDAVCLLDMNGTILRCNKAMESLLKKSSKEIIGGTCWELVHGTDKPIKGCPFVRMKKTFCRESLVLKVDDKWLNVTVDPVIDETGNLTSAVQIIGDITRRKQAEEVQEVQRETEERYRAFYDNACFIDVNPAWLRTIGYEREEVIGKWFGDFLHPDWKPHLEKNFSEFKRRGYVHDMQLKIRHKDGHYLDILLEGYIGYTSDDKFKQTYCLAQDITERKQAEERLKHLNVVLRAIRNVNQLITMEKDRDRLLQGACDNLVETRGYFSAWIALMDNSGKLLTTAESGLKEAFLPLVELIKRGELPVCGSRALKGSEVVAIEDPSDTCTVCPLVSEYAGRGSMTVRLEYSGKVYGTFSVSVPRDLVADEEEQALFGEVADDIAFALHNIELEEKRKKTEKALRESKERFLALTESTSDWIWEVDVYGVYTYVSPKVTDLLGYKPEEIIGKTPFDLVPAEEAERVAGLFKEKIQSGKPFSGLENMNIHKDGRHILLGTNGVPVHDKDGNVLGFRGIDRDITERKRSEERVIHLNAVLRAIRNVNQLLIKEKDRHRLIKGVCGNFIKTRGYYSAWIALFDESRNFIDVAKAGLDENFSRLVEILERGDLMRCGRKTFGQSGVLAIVNPIDVCEDCPLSKGYADREAMTVRLEYDDKVYGIMSVSIPKGMSTDREEQSLFKEIADDIAFAMHVIESDEKERQSQEALRKSEEFNKRIIESSIDCLTILDLYGRLEFMSEGGQKLMEIEDIGPYLNQPWIDLLTCSDDSYKAALEAISKAKEGNTGHFQNYCPTEKGTKKWWDIIVTPIIGKDGKVERLLSVSRDITEYKRLEDQFRQAQKMEAIGTLAGGVAHDFNNLLTAILGNAELVLMKVIKDESLREGIQEIKKAGKRAAALTRQLLAFSRKQIIKPKILDINEVINETKKMLKRMIGEDIEFLLVLEPELWKVYTDPGQIDQVVMNLVVNARDAMPRGGKLTIETANVELDETYFQGRDIESKPGPYVMLAVTDNGTGIDKETLSRIFDPFFTTKKIGRGTGLGLSTVYGIVKQNKGYCWVYSEPGKGTTFKIYFPRVAEGVVAGKEDEKFADVISGFETVLIVEDNDALRNITKKILQKYGYKILEAKNGEKALNIGETHKGPIHLLLTDVVMPGMSGSNLSEKMQSIRPETRVIYMSGYTDNAIVRHGILRQGINFIEKPFSPESLGKKVRQVLDGVEKQGVSPRK